MKPKLFSFIIVALLLVNFQVNCFNAEQNKILEEIWQFGNWLNGAYGEIKEILKKEEAEIRTLRFADQIPHKKHEYEAELEKLGEKMRELNEIYDENLNQKLNGIVIKVHKYFEELNEREFEQEMEIFLLQRLGEIAEQFNGLRLKMLENGEEFWEWGKSANVEKRSEESEWESSYEEEEFGTPVWESFRSKKSSKESLGGSEDFKEIWQRINHQVWGSDIGEIQPASPSNSASAVSRPKEGNQNNDHQDEAFANISDHFEQRKIMRKPNAKQLAMEILRRIYELNLQIWLHNYREFVGQLVEKSEKMGHEIQGHLENYLEEKWEEIFEQIPNAVKEMKKEPNLKIDFIKMEKNIDAMEMDKEMPKAMGKESQFYRQLNTNIWNVILGKYEILEKKEVLNNEKLIAYWRRNGEKYFEDTQKWKELDEFAKREKKTLKNGISPLEKMTKFGRKMIDEFEEKIESKIKNRWAEKQIYRLDYFTLALNAANIELAKLIQTEMGWPQMHSIYLKDDFDEEEEEIGMEMPPSNSVKIKLLADKICRFYLSQLEKKIHKKIYTNELRRVFDSKMKRKMKKKEFYEENEFIKQIRIFLNLQGENGELSLGKLLDNNERKAEDFVGRGKMEMGANVILETFRILVIQKRVDRIIKIFGLNKYFEKELPFGFIREIHQKLEANIQKRAKLPQKIGKFLYEKYCDERVRIGIIIKMHKSAMQKMDEKRRRKQFEELKKFGKKQPKNSRKTEAELEKATRKIFEQIPSPIGRTPKIVGEKEKRQWNLWKWNQRKNADDANPSSEYLKTYRNMEEYENDPARIHFPPPIGTNEGGDFSLGSIRHSERKNSASDLDELEEESTLKLRKRLSKGRSGNGNVEIENPKIEI